MKSEKAVVVARSLPFCEKNRLPFASCLLAAGLGAVMASSRVAAQAMEEVLVTAQKREQNLLEVPLSLTALGGDAIQRAGIESVAELQFYMPSFFVAENSGGGMVATAYVTRGIGVNGNIPYFEPSTALFIDGAYRSRSALGLDDLVNIERVEFLRGPQSTLYGRNASAGVLSVITQRPRDSWGGFIDATGQIEDAGEEPFGLLVRGETSGPLSDTVGAGVSFTYRDMEDLYEVTGSPRISSVNGTEDYTLRGQLTFAPSDALDIRLTGGISDRDANGPATELFFDDAALNGLLPLLESFNEGLRARQNGVDLGDANETFDQLLAIGVQPAADGVSVIPPHNDIWDRKVHFDDRKFDTLESGDFALDVEYELGNGWVLNAVSSYNEYDSFDFQDIDQLTLPIGTFNESQEGDAFSQELRVSSPAGNGPLDIIFGAFYLEDSMERQVQFALGPSAPLLGVGIDGDTGQFNGGVDTDSISAFTQLTWRPAERWEIAGGVRWIREEKDATKINSSFNGAGPASPVFLGGGFAAVFEPSDSGSDSRSTTDFTYSLNVRYDLSEDVMLYALHSRGFKSGGFNVVWGPVGPGEDGFEFDDETVHAFEVGIKGTFLDGRMQLSADAFYQVHDDYQTAAFVGTIFNLSNAEEATTQGIEVDLQWAATDRWRFNTGVALTDAKYEDFESGPCNALSVPDANGFCDQSGDQLPFVSDWNVNLGTEYEIPISSGAILLRADVAMAADYNPDLVLAPYYEQDGYQRVNLRATWQSERFDVTAFLHNATDEEIVDWAGAANVIPGASGQFVIQSARTYGVTARLKF